MAATARGGRPKTRNLEGEPRASIGFQLPAELKRMLQESADETGRSLSAETTAILYEALRYRELQRVGMEMVLSYTRGPRPLVDWLMTHQGADQETYTYWQLLMSALLSWRATHPALFERFKNQLWTVPEVEEPAAQTEPEAETEPEQ